MHWLRRSPAKMKSISFISSSAFLSAFQQASSCILLSAFSQVFSPKRESSSIMSKSFPRGPSPSFFEPTAAEDLIPTSPSMIIVCFPILCAKKSPRFKGSFCGKILNMQKNKAEQKSVPLFVLYVCEYFSAFVFYNSVLLERTFYILEMILKNIVFIEFFNNFRNM